MCMDTLEGQFLNSQVDVCPDAFDRVGMFWNHMSSCKDENCDYNVLAGVLGVLTIFHSNADSERIFSAVDKNKT